MKKIFSLVLVLCVLMSTVVFAEQNKILQDEMPPKVVTYVNEAGDTIAAKINDAQGNMIAEIKENGELILTDAHYRGESAYEIVVNRLTDSYEGVMFDVHHSDVDCKLHDHEVKVDVDEALASIDAEMDSHDLVMYELFDVMVSDEARALLVDGNYLEATFELIIEEQNLPTVIIFTPDGVKWEVLNYTSPAAKQFTVKLTEVGTLALLIDGHAAMGIGEAYEKVTHIVPGTDGSESGSHDGKFTPSATGKEAPEMVVTEGTDGERYVAYIRNDNGDLEVPVADDNYIVITAVAERDYVMDIQTHEHLEWAYDSILEAADVGELFTEHDLSIVIPEHEHGTIAGLLDEALVELGLDLTHDQLVVKDLFEVSAYGDYLHYLYDDANYLHVTFDANLDPSKPVVVIHSYDSVHWHVHPAEDYSMNANGDVTLKMYDLGAVAFLVEAEEELNPETAVQSPN